MYRCAEAPKGNQERKVKALKATEMEMSPTHGERGKRMSDRQGCPYGVEAVGGD
jgi:hypothetical protein